MSSAVAERHEPATRLDVDAARERVLALCAARRLGAETVDVERALGRVLAEDVVAPHDLPPFANSAMDGFALRGDDLPTAGERRFRIVGRMLAGADAPLAFDAGECVRITTGAPLPPPADTVVVKERVRVDGDVAIVGAGASRGANVRPSGEDYRAGDVAVRAGERLTPARLGVLASCGCTRVPVAERPRVGLFVTGDELVAPDRVPGYGQIRDSNRYSLGGLLRELGIEPAPIAHLRDDPAELRAALGRAAEECDLVLSSGGVSAGEADFLPGLVAELGRVDFWKVRMKPGMPVLCGEIGRALVFALPGNPVSTIATFLAFVRPALLALQGARECVPPPRWARVAARVTKSHGRTEFLRARLESRADGTLWATPSPKQGSGMLRGVAETDALIVVPHDVAELAPGSAVEWLPVAAG
ncbi:MAG TPA: gephyrin-like molybdotransferase Glp [Dokdonella sp.]